MFHQPGWITSWNQDLDSPVDCKEIKPVSSKGNQLWIFIGRTDTEAPIVRPPDAKSQLVGKDTDAGKDWRQKKRAAEDQMVGWHYWLNEHEFEQTLGDTEGQRSLAWCSLWGCRVRHDLETEQPQYLHFHTFNVEDADQSLVGELNPTYHGATKPGCLNHWSQSALEPVLQLPNLWATTRESMHFNERAHVTQWRSHMPQLRLSAAK